MKPGDLIENKKRLNHRTGIYMVKEVLDTHRVNKRTLIKWYRLPDFYTNDRWYDAATWKVVS